MADSTEQLIMRMGFDGKEAERGMNAMRDRAKKDAMEYAGFWEGALAKKDAAMAASQAKELATHKANQASLLKITEARLAKEAEIQAAIAAGSIPENMAGGAAMLAGGALASKYAFNDAGKLISVEGKAIEGMEAMGKAAHGNAGALREMFVIVHEGISGRFKQMFGSMLRLASLVFGSTGLIATGLVAAGTAAIVGPEAYKAYRARQAEAQSEKDLKEKEKQFAEIEKKREERKEEQARKNAEAAEYSRKERFKEAYGEADNKGKAHLLLQEDLRLQMSIAQLKRQGLDTSKQEGELAENSLRLGELAKNIEKEKAEAAEKKKEHDRETFELNKQMAHELREGDRTQAGISNIGFEAPTIAQLAGRGYTARLERAYGRGGRYDLENGRGPFGQFARQAELAAKQQMWDVIHGNAQFSDITDDKGRVIGSRLSGGAAYDDLQRRRFAENQLRNAGLDTPQMKANRMAESLDTINTNIAELNRRAASDGIVIKTDQ